MTNAKFRQGDSAGFALQLSFHRSYFGGFRPKKRYALVIGNGATSMSRSSRIRQTTRRTWQTNSKALWIHRRSAGGPRPLGDGGRGGSPGQPAVHLCGWMALFTTRGMGFSRRVQTTSFPRKTNIPSASFLQQKALALQSVLDTLQASGNKLNVVVLDACRDSPFSWSRSGTRGLTVVGAKPPGSIIVYATSAGSLAQDGRGGSGFHR